jgi:uncharacterized protein with PIN domain
VKFVVDGMLGKLSRWLRMMGHDVEYSAWLSDDRLMAIAKNEGRVLLTKDLELYQRCVSRGIDSFYVEGKNEAARLAELAERFQFPLTLNLASSRCPKCNTPLRSVSKEAIAEKVEPKTYAHYDEFLQCPNCGQVYWQGAHWDKIRATLQEASKILEKQA